MKILLWIKKRITLSDVGAIIFLISALIGFVAKDL